MKCYHVCKKMFFGLYLMSNDTDDKYKRIYLKIDQN